MKAVSPERRIEILEFVLDRVSNGSSMAQACKDIGATRSMVENWIEDDKDLSGRYTRARKTRALMIFDEMLEIQDSKPDSVINLGSDGESGSQRIDPAFVTWQANRVSLRKWVLARMEPGLFGDRLDLNHSGSIESPRPLDPLLAEAAAKRAEENGEV